MSPSSSLLNLFAARSFDLRYQLQRMNAPVNKHRWLMTPQTINAYFHPSLNEIVFPAAILQPPFFDVYADDAVLFGSLGAVVGHEMTHGFDDQGRKYDSTGNMRDWWACSDGEAYEARAKVMKAQAEQFEVHGVKLNGFLTMGENIADLGGLKLALRALKTELAKRATPPLLIQGLTAEQRFFIAWSQCWRDNTKEERAKQLVAIDPHGPHIFRANAPLKNMQEFVDAFRVPEGRGMYLPPEQRVDIW